MTAEVRYPEYGSAFREAQLKCGLTTTELAHKVKVTFATIARLANGNTKPRPKLAYQLNELFGYPVCARAELYNPETDVTTPAYLMKGHVSKKHKKPVFIDAPVPKDTPESLSKEIRELTIAMAKMDLRKTYLLGMLSLMEAEATENV